MNAFVITHCIKTVPSAMNMHGSMFMTFTGSCVSVPSVLATMVVAGCACGASVACAALYPHVTLRSGGRVSSFPQPLCNRTRLLGPLRPAARGRIARAVAGVVAEAHVVVAAGVDAACSPALLPGGSPHPYLVLGDEETLLELVTRGVGGGGGPGPPN